MKETRTQLWEIMLPVAANDGVEFTLDHHHVWDDYVRGIAGGLTILRTAKGQWSDAGGTTFSEKMIPVRVGCNKRQIKAIAKFTLGHYGQLAIFVYKISDYALIVESSHSPG